MSWNDNNNPWGQRGPRKNQNNNNDDFRKMWEDSRNFYKNAFPGGGGLKAIGGIFIVALLIYAATGFYRVLPDEHGVVMRFGKWDRTVTQPGLNYHLPAPIENVYKPKVTVVNRLEVGFRSRGNAANQKIDVERRMITGDENFVDVDFTVFWVIKNAAHFLFNVRNPVDAVKAASESAMRDVIGSRPIQSAFTEGRGEIEVAVKTNLQEILDSYQAGIEVRQVALQSVDPPESVVDAFNEVQRARTDKERMRNEADRYRNRVIPEARGEGKKIAQEALAYQDRVVNKAKGDSERFKSVYAAYKLDKNVMRERLYLEAMEDVLKNAQTVTLDGSQKNGGAPIPYFMQPQPKNTPQMGTQNVALTANQGAAS